MIVPGAVQQQVACASSDQGAVPDGGVWSLRHRRPATTTARDTDVKLHIKIVLGQTM